MVVSKCQKETHKAQRNHRAEETKHFGNVSKLLDPLHKLDACPGTILEFLKLQTESGEYEQKCVQSQEQGQRAQTVTCIKPRAGAGPSSNSNPWPVETPAACSVIVSCVNKAPAELLVPVLMILRPGVRYRRENEKGGKRGAKPAQPNSVNVNVRVQEEHNHVLELANRCHARDNDMHGAI